MILDTCLCPTPFTTILHINVEAEPIRSLQETLADFRPDFAGITFTTPSFSRTREIASAVKDYDERITLIGEGADASSFPEETLQQTRLDIVVRGEGDMVLPRILSGEELALVCPVRHNATGRLEIGVDAEGPAMGMAGG